MGVVQKHIVKCFLTVWRNNSELQKQNPDDSRSGQVEETLVKLWAMLIQECNNSGLTKREFCQQRGISEKSFYYWLRKLRSHMTEATSPQLVQLEPSAISDAMLQIQYRGAELKLPAGVDIEAVAVLLRSLQSL